jgi:hypothetical protein
MSAKEPTMLARDIERLSRFWKGQRAVVKTHQDDTSVVTGPGISVILGWSHDCATSTPVVARRVLVVSRSIHKICNLAVQRQTTLNSAA